MQEDLLTPTIPSKAGDRTAARESLHRKSKSMPASTPGTPLAGGRGAMEDEEPLTPLSPSSEGNIDKVGRQQLSHAAPVCTGHMCGGVVSASTQMGRREGHSVRTAYT